ncbi:Metallo-dependent phosphatase [Xylariaceae sp. FL1019]|nr:Metallo-dependent phosphatase [Xylariaceae sp. FL1019]
MVRSVFLPMLAAANGWISVVTAAEDSLYSSRMAKRFIDDEGHYNISFYHVNDVHAHLDEFSSSGTDCTSPEKGCYGGYSRIKHVIDETRPEHNDSLLLSIGDEFQGTLFYTYYKGEKIADVMNELEFDAMTLGNHEFDGGDDSLGDFLKNLTFPVLSANIQSGNEKLNSTIKPYHIFQEYQLAVIGVTTETTKGISSPGPTTNFSDAIQAVQDAVDEIRSTTNITRIAAITHIGYDVDKQLAQNTTGLYLILGGHSHTLLGDMEDAEGPYPTIEKNKDGDEVFIVTAYRWGEYLGYIDVTYDDEGKVLAYHGAPIHLTNTTEQDEGLQEEIDAWRVPFEAYAEEKVGNTNVDLDQSTCQDKECTLGDVICDALLEYRTNNTESEAVFAFMNAGGIRATISEGPVTRGQVITSFPFGNAAVELTYTGADLKKIFEGLVSGVNQFTGDELSSFFQISTGAKVEYNPDADVGSRLVKLTVGDDEVDDDTEYTVVTIDFVANGGDNILPPQTDELAVLDTLDEILVSYLGAHDPIDIELDGRISMVNGSGSNSSEPSATPTEGTSSPTTTPNSAHRVGSGVAALALAVLVSIVVS